MIPRAPKGTDDILPPAGEQWRLVLRTFDEMAEAWGYGLVVTPVFEATELFARGVGQGTDVVEKQMYTFEDKKGRSLTLRPEATASVVRAYLQSGGQGVFKGAYSGPMFRYEQPQAGRRRQFHQVGVEYLGEPAPEADAEVIEFGFRLLEMVGIGDVVVDVNSIGDPADRTEYREVLTAWLRKRKADLSPEAQGRIEDNPLRVLDSKEDAAVTADAPAPADHLGAEASDHFEAVRSDLERRGVPTEPAPRLVRGLDYYNRTVFEYRSLGYEAAQNSLGGGGRYDPLAGFLGGGDTAGVGLAMGVDRIVLAMGEQPVAPLDVFVVAATEEHRLAALELVGTLRSVGVRTDLDLGSRSLKAQFRAADRRGARHAAVVGDEWSDGRVTVKRLEDGTEEQIAREEVAAWVSG